MLWGKHTPCGGSGSDSFANCCAPGRWGAPSNLFGGGRCNMHCDHYLPETTCMWFTSLWFLKEGDEWFTMLNVLLKLFTCFPQWLKEPKRLWSRWMNSCFGPAGSITFRPGAPQLGRVALGTESKSQHEGWERSSLNALRKSGIRIHSTGPKLPLASIWVVVRS